MQKLRHPRLMTHDEKEESQRKYDDAAAKFKQNSPVSHDTYNEALKQWLPEAQRKYAQGKTYEFLCLQLKMFLEGTYTKEKIESLRNAKDNFEHYCETMETQNG